MFLEAVGGRQSESFLSEELGWVSLNPIHVAAVFADRIIDSNTWIDVPTLKIRIS
jgi:hypothetical protein